MLRLLLPATVALLLLAPAPALAETPAEACARLAAHAYEDEIDVPGVEFENLDVDAALAPCRNAVAAAPDSMPNAYRLGRVLQAQGKVVESTRLYMTAATGGYAMAEVAYSRALAQGRGVPQDLSASFYWMKRAADRGNPVGQMDAADKYIYAIGVAYDLDKAIALFEAAAAQDEAEAERRLGDIHHFQMYGRVDHAAAAAHYQRAIDLGSALAEFSYGQLVQCDCEIGDAKAAFAHFESAAKKGVTIAVRYLAFAHMHGDGVERDDDEALRLFRIADAQGDVTSSYYIGLFYSWGRSVPEDQDWAEKWWREAALAGLPEAQLALGRLYISTPGPVGRLNDGITWLERAGAAGLGEAYQFLFMHFTSIPVNDLDRAYEYAQLWSYLPDQQAAAEGRAMMKSVLRMKQVRGLEPTPPLAESGRG